MSRQGLPHLAKSYLGYCNLWVWSYRVHDGSASAGFRQAVALNEGQGERAPDVVVDVRGQGSSAGKQEPDPASDETSHLPEDDGVQDGRAHADGSVVGLVPVEELHKFPEEMEGVGVKNINWFPSSSRA